MTARAGRRGFTLVELLVVTGLFAVFFGLVVNGLRPNATSQVRQLSQSLSSAILAAQTRALGSETGAALIFDVTSPNIYTNTIFNADIPPFIVGDVVSGMPPTVLNSTTTLVSLSLSNADVADLAYGYKILFTGSPTSPASAWMAFSSPGTALTGSVSLRAAANQTIHNTPWPNVQMGGSLQFAIARFPLKSNSALDTTKQAAIDLRYSGIGNTFSGNYGSLHNKGPIAITFDRNGRLDSVMQYGTGLTPVVEPVNPTAPLYLLIANLADIQDDRSLQAQTSRWLAVAPGTGRVTVAANVPVSGTTEAAVLNARANALQGATGGIK
jgi:prepilin-type N-terminal cleavage/methylation domain-containing protein